MSDQSKKLIILDTNVLMHDSSSLYRFHEHDIFLPWKVLEELDSTKKGLSETAQNVRAVHRSIDELMEGKTPKEIEEGILIKPPGTNGSADAELCGGRIFFETEYVDDKQITPDNTILQSTKKAAEDYPDHEILIVSKDINLRVKARVLGINAEDYSNDQVINDIRLLYPGHMDLGPDFWDKHSKNMESWQEEGRTFYKVRGEAVTDWHPSLCLHFNEDKLNYIVREITENETATIEILNDYSDQKHSVWGIMSRNKEQNHAINMLMDSGIDFVSLLGTAGTGKTLLALAAGLSQTLDHNLYREIIMTRATVPVGEDIGFLPGTEEEKMTPWMGALMDNLEVLTQVEGGEWGRDATEDLLRSRIRIHSLNFMRGRTFLNKYIIIDEAQNLTPKQMKTLITRAGPGTKIVCLGNLAQIDTPYLTDTTSGLTYAVDQFRDWDHSGHITLIRGERSRLADYASEKL